MAIKVVENELELLTGVIKGDEEAFAGLFRAYHNQIGEYVFMLTGSAEMTEEIVQDVFVKVWLNREILATVDKFTSYLFIVTRNYTLNCIRKFVKDRKLQEEYSKAVRTHDMVSDAIATVKLDAHYQSLIDRAVAQLPPQQQKVFILRQQGLKNPEIARQMDISPDSVKKYQQWAMKAVSDFVKAHAALSVLLLLSEKA